MSLVLENKQWWYEQILNTHGTYNYHFLSPLPRCHWSNTFLPFGSDNCFHLLYSCNPSLIYIVIYNVDETGDSASNLYFIITAYKFSKKTLVFYFIVTNPSILLRLVASGFLILRCSCKIFYQLFYWLHCTKLHSQIVT